MINMGVKIRNVILIKIIFITERVGLNLISTAIKRMKITGNFLKSTSKLF